MSPSEYKTKLYNLDKINNHFLFCSLFKQENLKRIYKVPVIKQPEAALYNAVEKKQLQLQKQGSGNERDSGYLCIGYNTKNIT